MAVAKLQRYAELAPSLAELAPAKLGPTTHPQPGILLLPEIMIVGVLKVVGDLTKQK